MNRYLQHSYLYMAVLTLMVAFALRVIDLATIPGGFHYDEAAYLYRTWRLMEGHGLSLFFDGRTEPFDAFARAGFVSVVGFKPFTARLFSVWLGVIGVAATTGAARALFWRHPRRDVIALMASVTIAVLPAGVVLQRSVYRVHWVLPASMLAVMLLVWGGRTGRKYYFMLGGIATGVTAGFYTAGILFPLGVAAILLWQWFHSASSRWQFSGYAVLTAAMTAITLTPWFYYFVRVPNWLDTRADKVRYDFTAHTFGDNLAHIWQSVRGIVIVERNYHFEFIYNTFETPFLNVPLLGLFIVGIILSLPYWRRLPAVVIYAVAIALILPTCFTIRPGNVIRLVGLWGPIALLVGWGAAGVWAILGRFPLRKRGAKYGKSLAAVILGAIAVYSTIDTHIAYRYHFTQEPSFAGDPYRIGGIDYYLNFRARQAMDYIHNTDQPLYVPATYLDYWVPMAWLRFLGRDVVTPYDGEPLPDGALFVPADVYYSEHHAHFRQYQTTYVLIPPDSDTITLLPPLRDPFAMATLEAQAQQEGTTITNEDGKPLGYQLPMQGDHIMKDIQPARPPESAPGEPLVIFNDHLELLYIDTPALLEPHTTIPVTLYWRVRDGRNRDYVYDLQIWDPNQRAVGRQRDLFDAIYTYLYPPSMWKPNDIVTELRWIDIGELSPGGYNFVVRMQAHPLPNVVDFVNNAHALPIPQTDAVAVARAEYDVNTIVPETSGEEIPLNIQFGEAINLQQAALEHTDDSLDVSLKWEAIDYPTTDYTIFVHVLGQDGSLLTQQDIQPLNGAYPTSTWRAGTQLTTHHTLSLLDLPAAPSALAVGMYQSNTFQRLPAKQKGKRLPDDRWFLPLSGQAF